MSDAALVFFFSPRPLDDRYSLPISPGSSFLLPLPFQSSYLINLILLKKWCFGKKSACNCAVCPRPPISV